VTGQLLQLRKDIERRSSLLTVLNQQINIVSTHLHNLELVQQGQSAKLPDSEEMAADAAKAEEMLAGLEADAELGWQHRSDQQHRNERRRAGVVRGIGT
jgi:hypothetical protein